MSSASTYKLIELIVNNIDGTINFDSIALVSGNDYKITTSSTKWLNVGRTYNIGGVNYLVIDINPNTDFTIQLTGTQVAPTAVSMTLPIPFFYHGTFMFTTQERSQELLSANKTPFIYFNEPSTDTTYSSELDARDRDSDCDLYFMHEANFEDWTNEKHYFYAINAMENLIKSFIQSAKNQSFVGELENYGSESHVKWGVVNQNGHVRNLFNENLSGKKLQITIPFLKMPCDFDAYNQPQTGGGTAVVENSDASYTASVDAGDTLILPDTTIEVFVDGFSQGTTDVPSVSNNTINIIWT